MRAIVVKKEFSLDW
ncbi:hypothetical protein F383_29189 [Gossypium arboreum]|uniref:Uncharacterized protein n=1 Tax=Gossypium arboreum TaxID=29729 RepID=A0A0B0PEN6_GOSAR|nr:hypothetical protein F383_29189 [Gossypium arboreum]